MTLADLINSAKVLVAKVTGDGATLTTSEDLTIKEAKALQDAGFLVESSSLKGDKGYRTYTLKSK